MAACLFPLVGKGMQMGMQSASVSSGQFGDTHHEFGLLVSNAGRAEDNAGHCSGSGIVVPACEAAHLAQDIRLIRHQPMYGRADQCPELLLQITFQRRRSANHEMHAQSHVANRLEFRLQDRVVVIRHKIRVVGIDRMA
jgi:hypothetical protein